MSGIAERRISVFKAALAEVGYTGEARRVLWGAEHEIEVRSDAPVRLEYRAGVLASMAAPVPGDTRCCFRCFRMRRQETCRRITNEDALRFEACAASSPTTPHPRQSGSARTVTTRTTTTRNRRELGPGGGL